MDARERETRGKNNALSSDLTDPFRHSASDARDEISHDEMLHLNACTTTKIKFARPLLIVIITKKA